MTQPSTRIPFVPGEPVRIAADRVGRLTGRLNAAGYRCALFAADFQPGTFTVTIDPEGYTVRWWKLGGLREVAA